MDWWRSPQRPGEIPIPHPAPSRPELIQIETGD
jgi:hypothetical protein